MLTLKKEQLLGHGVLAAAIGLAFFLVSIYLVNLPIQLEDLSPGLSDVAAIRAVVNVPDTLQILAVSPSDARQSLFSLFVPAAIFLFAVQLTREDLKLTLLVLIILGGISGVIGVLQLAGSANGPLYFYRITNNGSAVGLFANRNHSAVLLACLFPMLAIFATWKQSTNRGSRNARQLLAIALAIILVPLILVTGSRSGMLSAIVGLIGGVLLYVSDNSSHRESKGGRTALPIAAIAVVLALVFATIYFSRAEAIERIFAEDGMANNRAGFWKSSVHLFWQYFPLGFGPGAFVAVFQKEQPLELLGGVYLNRLHNDWLETGLAFGLPGVLAMLAAVAFYVRRTFLLWARMNGARSAVAVGRMASIILAILAIASMSDYPLRTPAMMGFAALVLVWFIEASREPKAKVDYS
jgi:O-antigen ligase